MDFSNIEHEAILTTEAGEFIQSDMKLLFRTHWAKRILGTKSKTTVSKVVVV
jgi:hypothetical protein